MISCSFYSSKAVSGMFFLTQRLLLLLDTLSFHWQVQCPKSAANWMLRCCEVQMYPFVMLKLSDAVIWSLCASCRILAMKYIWVKRYMDLCSHWNILFFRMLSCVLTFCLMTTYVELIFSR
jgi:hypothetical protein